MRGSGEGRGEGRGVDRGVGVEEMVGVATGVTRWLKLGAKEGLGRDGGVIPVVGGRWGRCGVWDDWYDGA